MIKRNRYLKQIKPFINKPIIKVITGIRRCGKSTFLTIIKNELLNNLIDKENIISVNKDSLKYDFIKNYTDLYNYVLKKKKKINGKIYLFVDEIQEIESWEKAITSFLTDEIADIYITGSNANLLSTELTTLLTGRYIEIKMNTLVFSEFLEIRNKKVTEKESEFNLFLKYGGFPGLHYMHLDDQVIGQYLNALYNTVLLKDVVSRNHVRDVSLLEKTTRFIVDNCGNITSAKGINDYIKSQRINSSVDTIRKYLFWLVNANFINEVKRYDIKGKRQLEIYEKYFLADIGFLFTMVGNRIQDISGKLENIVYLELLSRGYKVYIGKLYNKEVDFIAVKNDEKLYIQVTYLLANDKVIEREFGVLRTINDNYTKIVLSLDKHIGTEYEGIKWYNLIDYLLDN